MDNRNCINSVSRFGAVVVLVSVVLAGHVRAQQPFVAYLASGFNLEYLYDLKHEFYGTPCAVACTDGGMIAAVDLPGGEMYETGLVWYSGAGESTIILRGVEDQVDVAGVMVLDSHTLVVMFGRGGRRAAFRLTGPFNAVAGGAPSQQISPTSTPTLTPKTTNTPTLRPTPTPNPESVSTPTPTMGYESWLRFGGARSGRTGDVVTILVEISEGIGIEAFQVDVFYDETALLFVEGTTGPGFDSFALKDVGSYHPGIVRILAAGLGASMPEGPSIIAELTFEVIKEIGPCHLSFSGIVPKTVGCINAEFYAGEPPPTPTFTPTPSVTPSHTPTVTPTPSVTPSHTPTVTPTPTPLIPLVTTDDSFKLEFVTCLDDPVSGTGSNLVATTEGFIAVLQNNEGNYLAWNAKGENRRIAKTHEIVSIVGMVPSATDSLLLLVDIPNSRPEVYRVSGPFETGVFRLPRITADLDGDGRVTARDLFYFQGQWRR